MIYIKCHSYIHDYHFTKNTEIILREKKKIIYNDATV